MIETVTRDLPDLPGRDGQQARVLVTGATGYVGGSLVRELLEHDYVVRVLVRSAERLQDYPWRDDVEVVEGDAFDPESLRVALHDVDVAYYLLHALMSADNVVEQERELAEKFSTEAKAAGVRRIVYLGGIANTGDELSTHMDARTVTGEALRSLGVPTLELRAGIILGSGSASFEMLRHLSERLPFMITPKWLFYGA